MIWGGLNMRMDNTGGSTWHLSCYVAKVVLNAGPKDNYHNLPSGPASRQGNVMQLEKSGFRFLVQLRS